MNNVVLIGRLTKDAEIRYTQEQKAVASFTLAIDRFANGEKKADFPRVVCFGKTAEIVERYTHKGKQVAVVGRIQTGNYKKDDGSTVYTTDVIAERIELLGSKEGTAGAEPPAEDVPPTFAMLDDDDDIPF